MKNDIFFKTLISLTVLLLITGCQKQKQTNENAINIEKIIPVQAKLIKERDISAIETSSGTVEGYYQTTLTASVPAAIAAIPYKVGDIVKKDKEVVFLDKSAAAASQYKIAKAQFENAKQTYQRTQAVAKAGGVSQDVLDKAKMGYEVAKAGYKAAKKNINPVAPFTARVITIYQNKNTFVSPGTPLVELATLNKLRVPLTINEIVIDKYKPGQKCFIELTNNDTLWGQIEKVSLGGSLKNHNFTVDAVFINKNKILKPGMYVTVHTITDKRPSAIAVSMDNIYTEGPEKHVFIIKDNKAIKTKVKIGIRAQDYLEILSGINVNDMLITRGGALLQGNERIKVLD